MQHKTIKLFSVWFVMIALLGMPIAISAQSGKMVDQKIVNADEENADSDDSTSDSNTDSSNMKSRREEIKKDIEEMKNKSAEQKEKAKETVLAKVKQAALKAVNSTISKLNKIKLRVAKMKVISDELKTELNSKIDVRIAVLEAKKSAIEAATTKEEVKAALGESQKEVRSTLTIVKDIVNAIHKTHLTNIIERLEKVLTKLETKATDLSGTAKTTVDGLIIEAKTALAAATTDISAGDLKKAKKNIKKAHKAIVKILTSISKEKGIEEGGENE